MGQVYYIEVVSDDEADTEEGVNEEDTLEEQQGLTIEESPIGSTFATLSGTP